MSTDPSVPEVSATTEKSSSKRLLDGKDKGGEGEVENPDSEVSTVDRRWGDENQPKRIKVETVGAESSVDVANHSKPIKTPDSMLSMKVEAVDGEASLITHSLKSFEGKETFSIRSTSPQTANYKHKKDEGDDGAGVGDDDVALSNTGATNAGVEVEAMQTGESSKPLHAPSPAVTRSRSLSTNKKKEVNGDSSQAKFESSTPRVDPKSRWRGKTLFGMGILKNAIYR